MPTLKDFFILIHPGLNGPGPEGTLIDVKVGAIDALCIPLPG